MAGALWPSSAQTLEKLVSWRYQIAERGKYGSVKARFWDIEEGKDKSVQLGEGSPVYLMPRYYESEDGARNKAQAKLSSFERGVARIELTLRMAKLDAFAEAPLALSGLAKAVDGDDFIIKSVRHNLAPNKGLTTLITASRGKS